MTTAGLGLADSLDPDGGTIQATDDSANARTLTHSAMTFASHKVDTAGCLVGNLRADPRSSKYRHHQRHPSFSYEVEVRADSEYPNTTCNQIILDVKTPSHTLDLTVTSRSP